MASSVLVFTSMGSTLLSVALLVFLAAAAGARIVAADFRLVAAHRLHDRIVAADARRLAVWRGRRSDGGSAGARKCRDRFFGGPAADQARRGGAGGRGDCPLRVC